MPHAVEEADRPIQDGLQTEQERENDLINQLLGGSQNILDEFDGRDLDIGEKAEDAEDYEDIADDDLADEEEPTSTTASQAAPPHVKQEVIDGFGDLFEEAAGQGQADKGDGGDDFDDLFGANDEPPSPKLEKDQLASAKNLSAHNALDALFSRAQQERSASVESLLGQQDEQQEQAAVEEEESGEEDEETREQRLLFQQAREEREQRIRRADNRGELPPPAESRDELFSLVWPQFEPKEAPRFGELLPGKKAYYLSKTPLKPPKPVHPTKLSLEIQQDQEKSFKLTAAAPIAFHARQAEAEARGLIWIEDTDAVAEVSEDEQQLASVDDTEAIAGVSWQDFVTLCEDWDIPDSNSSILDIEIDEKEQEKDTFDMFDDNTWELQTDTRPTKASNPLL